MKKPSPFAYIIGNPVSFFSLAILTLLFGAVAIAGSAATWIVVIPLLSLTLWANQAQDQIQKYRLWKLEWESHAGASTKRTPARKGPTVRVIVGVIAWVLLGLMALATHGPSGVAFNRRHRAELFNYRKAYRGHDASEDANNYHEPFLIFTKFMD